ncbi:MAG: flagellar assembly protein FliW [Eubacteriaceae bacterium]
MEIQTKYLGEIEVALEKVLMFSSGLMGFEESKEFVLLDIPDNDNFKFLQDIKNSYIAFLVVNPWNFFCEYQMDIPDEELIKMQIKSKEDIAIYNIVTICDVFKNSTANLLAPIILNVKSNIGKQYILQEENYTTKHPLYTEEITGEKNVSIK